MMSEALANLWPERYIFREQSSKIIVEQIERKITVVGSLGACEFPSNGVLNQAPGHGVCLLLWKWDCIQLESNHLPHNIHTTIFNPWAYPFIQVNVL